MIVGKTLINFQNPVEKYTTPLREDDEINVLVDYEINPTVSVGKLKMNW